MMYDEEDPTFSVLFLPTLEAELIGPTIEAGRIDAQL